MFPIPVTGSTEYPPSMAQHQKGQGYFPSPNSMFMDAPENYYGGSSVLSGSNANERGNPATFPTLPSSPAPIQPSYPYNQQGAARQNLVPPPPPSTPYPPAVDTIPNYTETTSSLRHHHPIGRDITPLENSSGYDGDLTDSSESSHQRDYRHHKSPVRTTRRCAAIVFLINFRIVMTYYPLTVFRI